MLNISEGQWQRVLWVLIGVLLLPALVIELGSQAFIDDEGIRSLVAFEMQQSGEYIRTTLNGEAYYKKPPLYNWLLLGFFTATGVINEWTARLPTVFFLLLFTWLIYATVKRATGNRYDAMIIALLTLTSGRILFWDSFLGLIDICFSAVIYANFMWLYFNNKAEKWYAYFIGSWLLTVVAFLLKGLPGLVFQVLTVGMHRLWQRDGRRLFHPAHFIGITLFLLLIGGYYTLLLQGADAATIFGTLFNESAQRTPTHHSIGETLLHVLSFPFEMTYHFLPWSLLLLFFLPLKALRSRLRHPFLGFATLVFMANIPIYWISPEVYPRYLLMLLPLVMIVGYHFYRDGAAPPIIHRLFRGVFLVAGFLLALGAWAPLFIPQTQATPWLGAKVGILVLLMTLGAWVIWRYKGLLILAVILQLLTLRVAFDWFVIPDRVRMDPGTEARADAIRIGKEYQDKPLYFLDNVSLQQSMSFYLATSRGEITRVWREAPQPDITYLVPYDFQGKPGFVIRDSLRIRGNQSNPHIYLIQYPSGTE
jgi:4-amino-4-deoxy-L-arabinose transferase-like glycosyltransferase